MNKSSPTTSHTSEKVVSPPTLFNTIMGKGALRFGGKSGFLPSPREIFKHPIHPTKYKKPKDVGYADGVQHPRGSSRDPIMPRVISVEEKIAKTIPEPKVKLTTDELSKLPAGKYWKQKNADMRRQFLKESYLSEARNLEKREAREKQKELTALQEAKAAEQYEESLAQKLTLPSIEDYLNGPIVRPRTEEEKEQLVAKRQLNRTSHDLKIQQSKAMQLLELYNASNNFIITEAQLDKSVEDAFERHTVGYSNLENLQISRSSLQEPKFNNLVKDALTGVINQGPDLNAVEESLSGEDIILKHRAKELSDEIMQRERLETEKQL